MLLFLPFCHQSVPLLLPSSLVLLFLNKPLFQLVQCMTLVIFHSAELVWFWFNYGIVPRFRLAFSCIWQMTPQAEIVSTKFTKSIICSRVSLLILNFLITISPVYFLTVVLLSWLGLFLRTSDQFFVFPNFTSVACFPTLRIGYMWV